MNRQELLEMDRQVGRRCRGPLKEGAREQVNFLLGEGKNEEAMDLDASSRKRCNYDLNQIFLADDAPLDGEEHDFECPQCGVKGKYRAAGPVEGEKTQ